MNKSPEPKKAGRPALPPGAGKLARIEIRTTQARKDKAKQLAAESGISIAGWMEQQIDNARTITS